MTTTPKEKTAKEWLEHLPEPLRTEALEACEKWPNVPYLKCEFKECIYYTIRWVLAGGGWSTTHRQLMSGEILPVEPEQSKQQEPKPMSDTEESKNKKLDMVELSEFVKKLVETIGEQQSKLEALQKELDTRCPKQIEDKQPEPAPVKLPVTVEDVWELEKVMMRKESWFILGKALHKASFNGTETIDEYRHESTAKFVDAVRKLTKIAEAQNEMCERGILVWYVGKKDGEVQCFCRENTAVGQIYFHSELGLKDCIRANEQLFKDYLRIQ